VSYRTQDIETKARKGSTLTTYSLHEYCAEFSAEG
jgi:hypothetical protein